MRSIAGPGDSEKPDYKERCFRRNSERIAMPARRRKNSSYAVFYLPEEKSEYLLTVTSEADDNLIFSPQAQLLDKYGAPLRSLPRERFTFRAHDLTVKIRVQPDARYLVVLSDAASDGQNLSRIETGGFTSCFMSGTAWVPIATGLDST